MPDFIASFAQFIQKIIDAIRNFVAGIRAFNDSQGELNNLPDAEDE